MSLVGPVPPFCRRFQRPDSSYSGMWHFYFTTRSLFTSTDAGESAHAPDLNEDVSDNPLRSDLHALSGRRVCAAA